MPHAFTEDQLVEQLKLAIEDVLDTGLPRAYSKELYAEKCTVRFQHIYEIYAGENEGTSQVG